jgi:AhpD family alkylhydroperoxidase
MMRISPIEKPSGLFARVAYWMSKRQLGKVMTPMKVVFARIPGTMFAEYGLVRVLEGNKLALDAGLRFLVQTHVATLNGCAFCVDIGRAAAIYRNTPLEKLEAVAEYRTHPLFTPRERAALAYVEEATRHKRVGDATFAALRPHFDEREIVEITWLCAVENYFNLINLPLEIESDGLCAIAERRRSAAAPAGGPLAARSA